MSLVEILYIATSIPLIKKWIIPYSLLTKRLQLNLLGRLCSISEQPMNVGNLRFQKSLLEAEPRKIMQLFIVLLEVQCCAPLFTLIVICRDHLW
jgi:hypothetical protein